MHTKEDRAPIAIRNRERGLCGCGRAPKPGTLSCQICADKSRDATKARRKLPGHCYRCGTAVSTTGARICEPCKPKRSAAEKRNRARRKVRGQCRNCSAPKTDGVFCVKHAEQNRRRARAYANKKRAAVAAMKQGNP